MVCRNVMCNYEGLVNLSTPIMFVFKRRRTSQTVWWIEYCKSVDYYYLSFTLTDYNVNTDQIKPLFWALTFRLKFEIAAHRVRQAFVR